MIIVKDEQSYLWPAFRMWLFYKLNIILAF